MILIPFLSRIPYTIPVNFIVLRPARVEIIDGWPSHVKKRTMKIVSSAHTKMELDQACPSPKASQRAASGRGPLVVNDAY